MRTFEYIRLPLDMGDLSELNALSSVGWRVVAVVYHKLTGDLLKDREHENYALLERELFRKT
jgi:hypothetical protein